MPEEGHYGSIRNMTIGEGKVIAMKWKIVKRVKYKDERKRAKGIGLELWKVPV